jgi:hypothetical protein
MKYVKHNRKAIEKSEAKNIIGACKALGNN